ncbi:hypothetical protein F5Y16DRAFT_385470 [Xylariaceae sp. FL0255]|nr:hypothetical protein F5Y16DRAFT_385470 [Xylariaceae sp. FL0255]
MACWLQVYPVNTFGGDTCDQQVLFASEIDYYLLFMLVTYISVAVQHSCDTWVISRVRQFSIFALLRIISIMIILVLIADAAPSSVCRASQKCPFNYCGNYHIHGRGSNSYRKWSFLRVQPFINNTQ